MEFTSGKSVLDTRASLLLRLKHKPGDPNAWSQFVVIYGPRLIQYCKKQGLQEADAVDISQEALLRFWKIADRFSYDPGKSFRRYLRKLVNSVWSDWQDEQKWQERGAGHSATARLMANLPAREVFTACLDEVFDQDLLDLAMRLVQKRVQPQTWEAFRLLALEGQPGKEVSAHLGMKLSSVWVARHNVQRKIQSTLQRLEYQNAKRPSSF